MARDAFAAAVDQTATTLSDTQTAEQPIIGVSLTDPIDCLITLFAVWQAGHCAVLVSPSIKDAEKARVIAKTGATLWIGDPGTERLAPVNAAPGDYPDAALILMTSGTTGDPKGVTHSLHTLRQRITANVAEIGEATFAQTLCTLPLFFGHGLIGNSLTAMAAGGTLHLWPQPRIDELPSFGQTLDAQGITFFSSVPTFWRMVLATSPRPETPPQRVQVGSAPLSQQLWAEISDWCGTDQVHNTYGMTETANWISGGTRAQSKGQDGYVGQPWGGEFRVIRDGALQAEGEGEVAVRSPGQMLGLWGDPGQTDVLMIDGFMRTGDIGRLDPDQRLWLIGRSKHEINVGGIKVLAEEVDLLLERHPDVAEACAFGLPDPIAGERPAAAVRTKNPDLTPSDLITWCRAEARQDAVPARIEIVDDIPKNDRGKIARAEVRERMLAQWS
ncbi:MAG: class I adenylate-forming enzyme family protein [Pseudomonadota bacterium]